MTDKIVLPGQPRQGLTRREIIKRTGGLAGFFMVPGFAASLAACSDKSVSAETSGSTSADVDTGGTDDTIRIGVVMPTEGVGAFVGDVIKRSLDVSLAELNARGGANGRKISLVYEGAMVEEMVDGAQRAYDKLAGVQNLGGILWCTALGLPQISTSILRDKMPIMSVFQDVSFERGLWPVPGTPRSIFQFLMSVERVVDPIIDYAVKDRGYTRVVLCRDILLTGAFEEELMTRYEEAVTKAGVEVLGDVQFLFGQTDFGPTVAQLVETDAEAVVIVGGPDETALIARELDARGHGYVDLPTAKGPTFNPQLCGTPVNMGERRWVDLAGDAAKIGSMTGWHIGGMLMTPEVPLVEMAAKHYPDGSHRITGGEEGPADGLYTLVTGISEAGSINDRDAITMAIENYPKFEFSYLPYSFSADDHQRTKPEELVIVSLEYESGPAKTDPPYELGKEWTNTFKGLKYQPCWVPRPTAKMNREIHPELVDRLLAQGYGSQCTLKDPNETTTVDSFTNECKIH